VSSHSHSLSIKGNLPDLPVQQQQQQCADAGYLLEQLVDLCGKPSQLKRLLPVLLHLLLSPCLHVLPNMLCRLSKMMLQRSARSCCGSCTSWQCSSCRRQLRETRLAGRAVVPCATEICPSQSITSSQGDTVHARVVQRALTSTGCELLLHCRLEIAAQAADCCCHQSHLTISQC
jgi:hypothetical protein